jgi:hypothetical protein
LEIVWQDYLPENNVHIVNANSNDDWNSLNGSDWRTFFNPPLTYWLSTYSELYSNYSDFGGGYVPQNVIIGKDYKVFHNDSGYSDMLIRNVLNYAISAFGEDLDPPEFASLLDNYVNINENMEFTVNFSDLSNIESAVAYYDLGNGEVELILTEIESDDLRFVYSFEGTIPAQSVETTGTIRFEVTDIYSNELFTPQYEIAWVEGIIPWQMQFAWEYEMDPEIGPATGVEFDGEYFYSAHYQDCFIRKYDLSGELLSDIPVSGTYDIRDLAWDGEYLYGSMASNMIWQIDVSNMSLMNTITSQEGTYRAIAYDDDLDGFWGNNWVGDIICTGRDGSTLALISDPGPMYVYGMAYDNVSTDGPYLWLYDQGDGYGHPQYIRQLEISTGQFTGVQFDTTLRFGSGKAYGLFSSSDYETGIFTIGGILLNGSGYNDNYTIFGLTYGDAPTSSQESTVPTTEAIQLSNYPNPFNPSTTISFTINTEISEDAELIIYNLKGQKIKDISPSLCHPEFIEGRGNTYTAVWNGTDDTNKSVSSGVYFYKMKAGKFYETKKMILMK